MSTANLTEYHQFIASKRIAAVPSGFDISLDHLPAMMKAFQKTVTKWSLYIGRVLVAADTGLGKTFTVGEVIRYLCENYNPREIHVCAPTGKAAQRVNQFLAERKIPVRAGTIHRILGVNRLGYDGAGWGFHHNRTNPLPCKFCEKPNSMLVEFQEPKRVVRVPLGKPKGKKVVDDRSGSDNPNDIQVDESEDRPDTGCCFDLGYALTFHRSQGSQWPVVILIVDDYGGAKMVASRELVYTGLSRAQRIAVTIGKNGTLDGWCRRQSLVSRKTFLKELIEEKSILKQ